MVTISSFLFAFGFVALSSSLPSEQNLKALYGQDSIRLTPSNQTSPVSRYDDGLKDEYFTHGRRVDGDFLIHRYTVNPIEIPTDKLFSTAITFPLPEGYLWTQLDFFIGQLESINHYIILHSINNRSELRMNYQPWCYCSVIRYEIFLYARKTT